MVLIKRRSGRPKKEVEIIEDVGTIDAGGLAPPPKPANLPESPEILQEEEKEVIIDTEQLLARIEVVREEVIRHVIELDRMAADLGRLLRGV